jgi:hypothetical protein
MPTPESKVKSAVVKILKDYGVYYFFPATHGYVVAVSPILFVATWVSSLPSSARPSKAN